MDMHKYRLLVAVNPTIQFGLPENIIKLSIEDSSISLRSYE